MEELTLSLNTYYKFDLPARVFPRYINRIPERDYINSFRKDVKNVSGSFSWDFKLTIVSSRKIKEFDSVSHKLIVEHIDDTKNEIVLTLEEGIICSRILASSTQLNNFNFLILLLEKLMLAQLRWCPLSLNFANSTLKMQKKLQ